MLAIKAAWSAKLLIKADQGSASLLFSVVSALLNRRLQAQHQMFGVN